MKRIWRPILRTWSRPRCLVGQNQTAAPISSCLPMRPWHFTIKPERHKIIKTAVQVKTLSHQTSSTNRCHTIELHLISIILSPYRRQPWCLQARMLLRQTLGIELAHSVFRRGSSREMNTNSKTKLWPSAMRALIWNRCSAQRDDFWSIRNTAAKSWLPPTLWKMTGLDEQNMSFKNLKILSAL